MSLDTIFADLASRGWLINNLYQEYSKSWRVNLRRPVGTGDWFTDWAYGSTLEEALEECISKLNDAEFKADAEVKSSASSSLITNLAERLGFLPKAPTITRRR